MTGTSAITNSTIQGGHQRNIAIDNSVGTLNSHRKRQHAFGATQRRCGRRRLLPRGSDTTANVTVAITNNTFARHGGDHINLTLVNNAVVDATITGNITFTGTTRALPKATTRSDSGRGSSFLARRLQRDGHIRQFPDNGTVAVPFRGNRQGGAIHVNKGSGTGTFSGSIENNVIGDPAVVGSGSSEAFGIIVGAHGARVARTPR